MSLSLVTAAESSNKLERENIISIALNQEYLGKNFQSPIWKKQIAAVISPHQHQAVL